MTTSSLPITLSPDQENALSAFYAFLTDPHETVFVLSGYAGTGKSTLVQVLLDRLDGYQKAARLINPSLPEYTLQLTATTNKAAENLQQITGWPVSTIHSFLGLLVHTDYRTGVTTLRARTQEQQEGYLLLIDEASYIDKQLLQLIFERTRKCKIVFIGDPAQLAPVKSNGTPVFEAKFPSAALTQVLRQAEGNPIITLATAFRRVVTTGEWQQFKPDGHHIQVLHRADFEAKIIQEFTRPNWRYADSKILAWTNKRVITYNQFVREHAKGSPHFEVGDYANNNTFVARYKTSLKTDQLVLITKISDQEIYQNVSGRWYTIDYSEQFFMPNSLEDKRVRIKVARETGDYHLVSEIEQQWIDLRAVYAQTINKSQGSTYGSVFIDLDDIGRCNNGDTLARMLYVAVSRARDHVYLVGDLA